MPGSLEIKLGTAVTNLPFSHPLLVAAHAALVDNLLEGRLLLGIGAGILRSDARRSNCSTPTAAPCSPSDRPYPRAMGRRGALQSHRQILEHHHGKTLWPEIGLGRIVKPFQKPHPPILGTATDPNSKGLIALGRRGWWPISSHFLHANCLPGQWSNYAQGCAEGGRKADRANWRVARSIFVADDDKAARAYGGDDPNSPYRFYMSQLTPS